MSTQIWNLHELRTYQNKSGMHTRSAEFLAYPSYNCILSTNRGVAHLVAA
jgi:hypothetical protein